MRRIAARMKHGQNWNEFQWEQELRRHENRIARFYQDLVYCIDLPAEEANGDFQLGDEDPASAPPGSALQDWLRDHDDEEEEDNAPERRPTCFAPVDAIDQLGVFWNLITATKLEPKLLPCGMGINCAFAKLLARVADFTEPAHDATLPLRLTLGKRSLTDLKELSVMLESIAAEQKSLLPEISRIQARLLIVREQLVDGLRELRSSR